MSYVIVLHMALNNADECIVCLLIHFSLENSSFIRLVVAFAQHESCWRSQQSVSASMSKSRDKGGPDLWQCFGAGKYTAVLCICKLLHRKRKLAD